jgi:hypothetical protein
MSKSAAITASVDAETLADLRLLAKRFGCSVEHLVSTAILRFVSEEAPLSPDCQDLPPYVDPDPLARDLQDAELRTAEALRAYIQPGLDDADAGRTIGHEEFMRRMRERFRSRNAA